MYLRDGQALAPAEAIDQWLMIDWLSSIKRLHQHSIGYVGDSFTGQKTQPTVSKYWRKRRYKVKKTEKMQTTQNTSIQ